MKDIVVLIASIASIALCTCTAVSLVPDDNSHYVEGESRYIWMLDGEGVSHLVDLEESVDEILLNVRNEGNNQYWLYTRQNPNTAETLVYGDIDSISNSNYNSSRPIAVIVHGWQSNGNTAVTSLIRNDFLAAEDTNVIIVDWRTVASSNYLTAVITSIEIGQLIGNFLEWIINTTGGDWNNVHLVRISLGAHVVGRAGRQVNGQPARVTGLDPAGPLWIGNPNALNRNDGQYVEAIHTDGGIQGILIPIADADFYPNGGRHPQPGCSTTSCSHGRAPQLFASSIRTDHLQGRLCDNYYQAQSVECSGIVFNMGNSIFSKRGSGIYGLTTGSSWPY